MSVVVVAIDWVRKLRLVAWSDDDDVCVVGAPAAANGDEGVTNALA